MKFRGYVSQPDPETARYLLYIRGIGLIRETQKFSICRKHFPDYLIMCCLSGSLIVRQYGKTKTLAAGKTCFLNLEKPHHYYSDPENPCRILWIHFGGLPAEQLLELLGTEDDFYIFDCPAAPELIFEADRIPNSRRFELNLQISSLIYRLMTACIQSIQHQNRSTDTLPEQFCTELDAYLEEHLYDKITLKQMAQDFHFSEAYFCRKVRAATGRSPMYFLMCKRIWAAQYRLIYTDDSLQKISEELHFCDRNHFSAVFRRMTGYAPAAYRAQQRG